MIFGFLKSGREVKEHHDMLVRFVHMVATASERMGHDMAFRLVSNGELVEGSQDRRAFGVAAGRLTRSFRFRPPLNEFDGSLEEDVDQTLNLAIVGSARYEGFMLVLPGLSGRMMVSAKDGIRTRVTTSAILLKTHFIGDGAFDSSLS